MVRKKIMYRNIWHIEKIVPLLLMGGLMIHLMNLAHYLQHGTVDISQLLLPLVDLGLLLLMTYSSLAMIVSYRRFLRLFDMRAPWRKVVYWLIAFYVTISIPGHINYLLSGDTAFFESFPWWFSPLIIAVYVGFIAYFFSLKPARMGASSPSAA
jgi:hypothetical protein